MDGRPEEREAAEHRAGAVVDRGNIVEKEDKLEMSFETIAGENSERWSKMNTKKDVNAKRIKDQGQNSPLLK